MNMYGLWESTKDLHKRFDAYPPDPLQVLMVFEEEVREVQEAFADRDVNQLAHECVDVIVTMMGLLMSIDDYYPPCLLSKAIDEVITKNDAKTSLTHRRNGNGKIERIAS